jgi:hypothetical protein
MFVLPFLFFSTIAAFGIEDWLIPSQKKVYYFRGKQTPTCSSYFSFLHEVQHNEAQ